MVAGEQGVDVRPQVDLERQRDPYQLSGEKPGSLAIVSGWRKLGSKIPAGSEKEGSPAKMHRREPFSEEMSKLGIAGTREILDVVFAKEKSFLRWETVKGQDKALSSFEKRFDKRLVRCLPAVP